MQDTSVNPYTVRLHSARLVNAYMGDLRLAGSRRNTQEDRGEERTYKVTVNTALDLNPFSRIARSVESIANGTAKNIRDNIHKNASGENLVETANGVIDTLKVLSNLPKEAELQKEKKKKEDKENERLSGINNRLTTPQDGGFAERYGFVVGKAVADVWSRKMEDVRNAMGGPLGGRAEGTGLRLDTRRQPAKNN